MDFTLKPAWDLERLEPNNFFPIPASVAFARKCPLGAAGKPLTSPVECWKGRAGGEDVQRVHADITDTGKGGESPYGGYSRQGATIVPRCLFFVTETTNTATVQAAPTVTVNPRRGSQDKAPWKNLDLTAITGQTVESRHLVDVHLGETIAPYVALEPLKALLPVVHGDGAMPVEAGGIRVSELGRRMRGRWQTINAFWEENKAPANQLNLLERLDYVHNLSSQLEWQQGTGTRPVRIAYAASGTPTAALVSEDEVLIDYTLFWVACKDVDEANYLLAIINSDALYKGVQPLMPKGQFGARHVQKHLWRLSIPAFDPSQQLHVTISEAGAAAAAAAGKKLEQLRQERGDGLTIAIARRELRNWLRVSTEGKEVETAVARLLAGGAK